MLDKSVKESGEEKERMPGKAGRGSPLLQVYQQGLRRWRDVSIWCLHPLWFSDPGEDTSYPPPLDGNHFSFSGGKSVSQEVKMSLELENSHGGTEPEVPDPSPH